MAAWPVVLDELMRTRRAALVGYATLLTGDLAAAEDVVHDAIVKAFSRGRAFSHINKADAYVRRTIVSVYIDRTRRDPRFRAAAPLVATAAEVAAHGEGSVDLDRALANLSPQLRAVVVLRYVDDLTLAQIADRLHLAEGTVKRYLHDAQQQLTAVYSIDIAAIDGMSVSVVAPEERTRT